MNQPYARVNQPYATLTLPSALCKMFGVQLYKNNARALLSRILSILNSDRLNHARSVCGVYECLLLKALMPITFSSPRAQPEVVLFLVSNESPYFSHYNPKISASNSPNFGSYSRKCTY